MKEEIKKRIEAVRRGEVPEGYGAERAMLYPLDWGNPEMLNTVLQENKGRNDDLRYGKDDVLSVSGEQGVVNQIDLLGRSYAGESVAPYHVVDTGDVVYTKSPLKDNPYGIIKQNRGVPGIVSTLYAVYHCNSPITGQYIENYFCIDTFLNNYLKPLVKRGAKNDMKVNNEDVLHGKVPLPPIYEQERINEILATCDKVIELKQKLIEELQRLKKIYMKKMFPQKGQVVPEIRFPGFTGPWEQCKFSDVFSFLQNNTLSRTELSEESGAAKNVHYGDVLMKFGEYLDVSKEQFAFIPAETVAEKFKSSFLQNGDIIIADTAEDETVGKCCEIVNSAGIKLVSGLHTMPCRPNQKYASGYLGYYMNSPAYHDQLLPLMQGTKVTSVSKTAISGTVLTYPASEAEQSQISQCLLSIDNLITHHQRNLEEEQRKKKALMQLLLTGLVRVKI